MGQIKKYAIPLNGIPAADIAALKRVLEAHAALFNAAILSAYGGDIRYSVMDNSFTVTDISGGRIDYLCQVNYFAPCNDQNDFFQATGSAYYKIANDEIVLELDEKLWNVD